MGGELGGTAGLGDGVQGGPGAGGFTSARRTRGVRGLAPGLVG